MPYYNILIPSAANCLIWKGFMREDEANFIGYLGMYRLIPRWTFAVVAISSPTGWVYAGGALARWTPESFMTFIQSFPSRQPRTRPEQRPKFWERFERTCGRSLHPDEMTGISKAHSQEGRRQKLWTDGGFDAGAYYK